MSSTGFPVVHVWTFPSQRLIGILPDSLKTHQMSSSSEQTAPALLQTTGAVMLCSLLLWAADVWIETLHTLLGFAMSVSACRPPQHHGKAGAAQLHFSCPLPSHVSATCFSALLGSAPAVWISLLEEWQSRFFAPLNTFPSLQLCPCSGRPASGNWTAPATQFFFPLCSHSQRGQTVPGMVPEYLGTGADPG